MTCNFSEIIDKVSLKMVFISSFFHLNMMILTFIIMINPSSSFALKSSYYSMIKVSRISSYHVVNNLNQNRISDIKYSSVKLWSVEKSSTAIDIDIVKTEKKGTSKIMKRWITGLTLGGLGTLWISSGNGAFTLGFLLLSLLAQKEYYSMVKATGVEPAEKTSIVTSFFSFACAAIFPSCHELVMPLSATFLMFWLLIFNKKSASINEISTSLLGMFYVGFLPSFWVRLRALEMVFPTKFPMLFQNYGWIHADTWTFGAILTWWTWLSIVSADVGAYFIGKMYGKNKLGTVSAAAGAASPNKTIEGAIGGIVSCMISSMVGANLMQWPLWPFTGSAYGLMLGIIALVGDLTASMMKRDAGMKDSGNLLPGHGGLLDRIDSYMFTAPAAFFFCRNVLPIAMHFKKTVKQFPLFFL